MEKSIYTEKRYKKSDLEDAKKISKQVESRFAKWLVSHKYLVNQADVDHLLSRESEFCDSIIMDENERIKEKQRLLLECEQERVKERILDEKTRQERLKRVSEQVQKAAETVLSKRLNETEPRKLIIGTAYFGEFASFAYGASLDFNKLGSLCTLSNSLSHSILDLVSNAKFCEQVGKPVKIIKDPKTAIGFIGIENCKMIYPVLMSRPLLKWADRNTKTMLPKMWQNAVTTANATKMRLQDVGYKEPDVGILIGMLRSIGQFIISNNYTSSFDDALSLTMVNYRDKNMRDEYFSCADVTPTMNFVPAVIEKFEAIITQRVIETFDWDMNAIHIKNAIIEDIKEVPILDRSILGAALAQGKAYSIFDMMDKSHAFVGDQLPYWLAHNQIDMKVIKNLRKRNPSKFEF